MNQFWSTFFPNDAESLAFVVVLIAWFGYWLERLKEEAGNLDRLRQLLDGLDQFVPQLGRQQAWRDQQRLQGGEVGVDPALFFDNLWKGLANFGKTAQSLKVHFRTIFAAGCEESLLDSVELNSQTCKAIGNRSEQFRYEFFGFLLLGAFGTLLCLSSHYEEYAKRSALPPVIWGTLLCLVGGALYLRHNQQKLSPVLASVRQKTTTLWIPRLYPTVAQRAAQWATRTLQNGATVVAAADKIEKHALNFVGAVDNARQAAETFSGGMQEFSRGIQASDSALKNAQLRLAQEVGKFADSLKRWGKFEDEIRNFYSAVEGHQKQLVHEHKAFESMLSGYYNLVRQSTETLQKSASEVSLASNLLPEAFQISAKSMTDLVSQNQANLEKTIDDLANVIRSTYRDESRTVREELGSLLDPVLKMEDRLRALSTPFESASSNLVEVATNLLRLNQNFEREVLQSIANLAEQEVRSMKSGA